MDRHCRSLWGDDDGVIGSANQTKYRVMVGAGLAADQEANEGG